MKLNEEQSIFIDKLYKKMYAKMSIYAKNVVGNKWLAEEAVQEAFRIACSRPDAVMSSENPNGWMIITLKNVIRNIERSTANQNKLVTKIISRSNLDDRTDNYVDSEYANLISDPDFILLKRIVYKQYSMLEAAAELGISVEACRKRVQRAKAKMQRKLKEK
jgi:sigma-70, region 4